MNRTRSAALRGGLSYLFWLFALLAAMPLAAKPTPLSQPLDLSGKRVLIVPMLGRDAGSYSLGRMIFFPNEERRLANVPPIDADTVAAREVEARLDGLGVEAEVLQIEYDDVDIYGDRETSFFNSQMPPRWKIEAIARQLLHERRPDAVLMPAWT